MKKTSTYTLIFIFWILFTTHVVYAANKQLESFYRDVFCNTNGGQTEVRVTDEQYSPRCDCVLETKTIVEYAVEVDFASKWAEAIGQSLYYSTTTGKKAGIALILEDPKEERYLERLELTIKVKNLDIRVWTIKNYN